MEQSPSRAANQFSASQGVPGILWNPKDYNRIHKYPLSVHKLDPPPPETRFRGVNCPNVSLASAG